MIWSNLVTDWDLKLGLDWLIQCDLDSELNLKLLVCKLWSVNETHFKKNVFGVVFKGKEQLEQSETAAFGLRQQKRDDAKRWADAAGESAQRSSRCLRWRGTAVHRWRKKSTLGAHLRWEVSIHFDVLFWFIVGSICYQLLFRLTFRTDVIQLCPFYPFIVLGWLPSPDLFTSYLANIPPPPPSLGRC